MTPIPPEYRRVDDLFTIKDLGGWDLVQRNLFDERGLYDRALSAARDSR